MALDVALGTERNWANNLDVREVLGPAMAYTTADLGRLLTSGLGICDVVK